MSTPTRPANADPSVPLTPEQKIKVLKVQLREAREKAQLFEAVLDVLRRDFGVRVVKKPWASPLAKACCRAECVGGLPLLGR